MSAPRRGALKAVPPHAPPVASQIVLGADQSIHSITKGRWQPADPLTTTLADPPWVEGFVPGTKPVDVRPAPPQHGVAQHATFVEIVKDDTVRVLVDGVSVAPGENNRYWLPRFREQRIEVPDSNDASKKISRRTVAPVFVAMRIEDGSIRPQSARVVVKQRIYDDGVEVLGATTVVEHDLVPYSTLDTNMNVVAVPYPAWVTRPPSLRIQDNASKRRWDARFANDKSKRARNVLFSTLATLGLTAAQRSGAVSGAVGDFANPIIEYVTGTEDENPVKDVWRWALLQVSPGIREWFGLAAQVFGYNQFEAKNPPPAGKTWDIPLPEAVAVMERIVETRANGSLEKDRSVGLTPLALSQQGFRKDSAFLDWLVYGEKKQPKPLGVNRLYDWFGSGSVDATANRLDPTGMDPYYCAESRCEFFVEVHVVDGVGGDVGSTVYTFDTLRTNGIDAHLVMAGYEEMRERLREQAVRLIERIEAMRDEGPTNWITGRLGSDNFIYDGKVESTWWPFGAAGSERKQTITRWKDFSKAERRERLEALRAKKGNNQTPLLFDLEALKNRLLKEVIGEDEELERKAKRATAGLDLKEMRPPDIPDNLPVPDTFKLPQEEFDRFIEESRRLYRLTHGIPDSVPIDAIDDAFVRWRDLYSPLITERFDARLGAVVVPQPRELSGLQPVAVLRRLPQLAAFSSKQTSFFGTATALPTARVPHNALSNREHAKSAVDASVAIWSRHAVDMKSMTWTVEPPPVMGFHAIEVATDPPLQWETARPYDPNWRTYLRLSPLTGQTFPGDVGRQVFAFEQTPDSVVAAAVEATGTVRGADAAVLLSHRLPASVLSWSALVAMANAIAYEILRAGTEFELHNVMDNAVVRARRAAVLAADLVDAAYGKSLKLNTLLTVDDILWACVPYAGTAHAMLRQFSAWLSAQAKAVALGRQYTRDEFERQWPKSSRLQATAFAKSLRVLARATKFDLAQWPFASLQSLVIDITKLPVALSPYGLAKNGLDEQLQAATAMFQRVSRLLARCRADMPVTAGELWCLIDVAASRPIVFQAAASQRPFSTMTTLQNAQADWKVPLPVDRARALRSLLVSRMPALLRALGRLNVDELGATPIDSRGVEIIKSAQASDITDRVLVPPCGISAAGMLDVGNASALEDSVVWLDALQHALSTLAIANEVGVDTVRWRMGVDNTEHPYVIRVRQDGECTVQGVRRVPNAVDGATEALNGTLPATIMDVQATISDLRADEQPTGQFVQRKRALTWLVDRFLQLQLVAIGMREATPKVHRVLLDLDTDRAEDVAFVATAMCIAVALRATSFAWNGELRLAVGDGVDVAAVMAALNVSRRACVHAAEENAERDPLKAVSLAELCHVLACKLP